MSLTRSNPLVVAALLRIPRSVCVLPSPAVHDAAMSWFRAHPQHGQVAMLPSPHPAVMFQTVGDGAVLLHTQDEIYFGLNAVGARVWQMLPPACADIDDVYASLATMYPDTDAQVIRADVDELLAELRSHRLVIDPA